jgi:hypothetical protein
MTVRYTSLPTAFWDELPSQWARSDIRAPTMCVIATDPYQRDNALLDSWGNKLVAIIDPNPIGFGR